MFEPYLFQIPQFFPSHGFQEHYRLLDPLPTIYLHLQKGEKPHLHSGTGNRPFVFGQLPVHYVDTICHFFEHPLDYYVKNLHGIKRHGEVS